MEAMGGHITWEEFKTIFLNKYFPSNVKDQKEIEFLTLQQGDMTVDDMLPDLKVSLVFEQSPEPTR
jgi:hypothetical protein